MMKIVIRAVETAVSYGCFMINFFLLEKSSPVFMVISFTVFIVCLIDLSNMMIKKMIDLQPWFTMATLYSCMFLVCFISLVSNGNRENPSYEYFQMGLNILAFIVFLIDAIFVLRTLCQIETNIVEQHSNEKNLQENKNYLVNEQVHQSPVMVTPEHVPSKTLITGKARPSLETSKITNEQENVPRMSSNRESLTRIREKVIPVRKEIPLTPSNIEKQRDIPMAQEDKIPERCNCVQCIPAQRIPTITERRRKEMPPPMRKSALMEKAPGRSTRNYNDISQLRPIKAHKEETIESPSRQSTPIRPSNDEYILYPATDTESVVSLYESEPIHKYFDEKEIQTSETRILQARDIERKLPGQIL